MSATQPLPEGPLSAADITRYHTDGFLHIPGLFTAEEIAPLCDALAGDQTAGGRIYADDYAEKPDAVSETRPVAAHEYLGWTGPGGNDLIGMMIRVKRMVDRAEQLVGEPVYHWHTNLVRKPARSTGRIPWHSDLSRWYQDGALEPAFSSCVLAVTPTTRTNGCLQFMRGSQRCGRLDRISDEHVAFKINEKRLAAMLERYPPVPIELAPGDAVFFHPAAVHSSDPNQTDAPRTQIIFTYNAISNTPVFDNQTHHAFSPLHKTSDSSLREKRWQSVFELTRATRIDDPNDPASRVYGKRPSARVERD